MKKIIFLIGILVLSGCVSSGTDYSAVDLVTDRYDRCKERLKTTAESLSQCQVDMKFDMIHEDDLHTEATRNCVLIIMENNTDWSEPSHYSYKNIVPLRTLTLETDAIHGYDYDDFKYWLACNIRYR